MQTIQTSSLLNIAVNAAREAGKTVVQNIDKFDRIKLHKKNQFGIASEVDILTEEIIIQELQRSYPDFSFIAEESGNTDKDSEYCWVIDPINGTFNFIHGHPHCAISIGLKLANEVIVGVIYDPFRNELFTARKGAGAQLDGRRIRVSNLSRLSDSLLSTSFPHPQHPSIKSWLKSYAAILPRCQSIHKSGSSALDLAYIACGRYDGAWQYGLKPWDIAAGSLIVKEAGGLTHPLHQNQPSDTIEHGENSISANPKILEKLKYLLA